MLRSKGNQANWILSAGRKDTNCSTFNKAGDRKVAARKAGEKQTTKISANSVWVNVGPYKGSLPWLANSFHGPSLNASKELWGQSQDLREALSV